MFNVKRGCTGIVIFATFCDIPGYKRERYKLIIIIITYSNFILISLLYV